MICLGFDPGTSHLAYGVVEMGAVRAKVIAHGILGTRGCTPADKMDELAYAIDGVFNTHCPDVIGYESQRGVSAYMEQQGTGSNWFSRQIHEVTGMLRFAARCALDTAVPLYTPEPSTIKVGLLGKGNGRAEKAKIVQGVKRIFGIQASSHVCDAIAVAITVSRMHRLELRKRRESRSLIT